MADNPIPFPAEPWFFEPGKPRLADYPCKVADASTLPNLETSLKAIGEYQRRLWANREKAVLLIVHGTDASGKDSLIRTLAAYMDPAGFHAWSFSRPGGAEKHHDFLWRVTPMLPAFGEVAAFNRSHHEAVIAERAWPVWQLHRYNWEARYASIRFFERHLVQEGTTVLKFWLNLSADEHRRRLLKRLDKPHKQWKFDPSDIEAWERRDELLGYAEEALAATHLPEAPWLIIPGDSKPNARAIIARLLADKLRELAPEYPSADKALLARYRRMLE
ncbi:polyphosphate kinase [Marinobacter salicampi]|uniref:polyphosphate kinase n=1 Tax=Marinobacter salicampi TaxID=435907 RepID=UPI00140E6B3E|nr:polyphosphate kinase [Marinobacter salicampi]